MLIYSTYSLGIARNLPAPTGAGIVILPPNGTITLSANTSGAVAWQWYKNDLPIPMEINSTLQVSSIGKYTVVGFNSNSCSSPVSDAITVVNGQADLAIMKNAETKQVVFGDAFQYQLDIKNNGPQTAIKVIVRDTLPKELVFKRISFTSKGNAFFDNISNALIWTIDSLQINEGAQLQFEVIANKQGSIVNKAYISSDTDDPNLSNNKAQHEKTILGLKIPNVFTPDGDGKNDTFDIPNLLNYPDNDIIIFNRWGNSIYEKHNYKNDWNGQGLNEGTYFYILRVRYGNGQQDTYNGYVTLLRGKNNG